VKRACLAAIAAVGVIALTGCGSSNNSTSSTIGVAHTGTTVTQQGTTTGTQSTTTGTQSTTTGTQPATTSKTGILPGTTTGTPGAPGTRSNPYTAPKSAKEAARVAFRARINTICLKVTEELSKDLGFSQGLASGKGTAANYAVVSEAYGRLIAQLEKVTPLAEYSTDFAVYLRDLKLQGEVYPRLDQFYASHGTSRSAREALEDLGEQRSQARRAAAKRMGADGCDK
jgi:hypothetical protein